MNPPPKPMLGSAMWGWTVPRQNVFELLDGYYREGYREVDSATNYPINKIPEDFRQSEKILLDWVRAHGVHDLKIIMKIGSINNLRTPDFDLNPSFIMLCLDQYHALFGQNLDTLMIHWDNREEPTEIQKTLEAFDSVQKTGLQVGISGIKNPELYARLNQIFKFDLRIQIKHNMLYSDYGKYQPFHHTNRFIAYGINAGGLKLDINQYSDTSSLIQRGINPDKLSPVIDTIKRLKGKANLILDRPRIQNFNHLSMIFSYYSPDLENILIGSSAISQLKETLQIYKDLMQYNYSDVYHAIKNIQPKLSELLQARG